MKGGADEAQTNSYGGMLGADELKCACMKKSERSAYLRLHLKWWGEG